MNGWRAVAERQYGVVTRHQLRSELTDRQIHTLANRRDLERVYPAVFRVAGSYPSARQRAMAALLWCGNDALLSHGTAAELFRLPVARVDTIHVTATRNVRRKAPRIVLHRSERLDRFMVDGLACTAPARTIIDLAPALDGEQLEDVFERARRMGLVTVSVFGRRCEELCGPGRPGSSKLRDLLRVVERRPKESRLEVRTARLLRANRIRPEVTQHRVPPYRLDFAWPSIRVAVECDGFEWHGNRLAWKRDRRRNSTLEARGWRMVHLTWDDVTGRPVETVERVRAALEIRPRRSDILSA